ncbi:MAG TPA: AAA family ATPase [Candidatus Binatia bacterium]|nr:AAA family ATPase [Candidatus Binatia bacterium]
MEQAATVIAFGPFRLWPAQRQLWKDAEQIELRPTPLAVLTYLAQHPGRVVSAEELRQAVWGRTYVSRTAIRVCVREVRQALGDEAAIPRYIETVARRGYCFIAPLSTPRPASSFKFQVSSSTAEDWGRQPATNNWQLTTHFVGRQRELTQLQQWFAQAQQGQRQVVLVSGEPGIGKTTLIEVFLSTIHSPQSQEEKQKAKIADQSLASSIQLLTLSPWIGRGQCVESYGPGEAYLPILEALGRLGRELGTGKLTAVLQQHAPMWLAQLPALTESAERVELQRQVAGATQERMLRELCDALEVLTAEQPLLLVLEDLQWSDTATLAWLAAVARRPDPARLLVIGTYRSMDVIMQTHPLRGLVQELRTHRLCREVRLELLSVDEVREYVHQRFANSTAADELGLRLHQRTDGNPLFLTTSVDALVQQGVVSKEGDRWVVGSDLGALDEMVPEDLQHLITKQFEALAIEDQQMLEVASVNGVSFSPVEVAAGCQQELKSVEIRCEQLARRGQFIAEVGFAEGPNDTLSISYKFHHALYQQGIYARLSSGQKVRLHRVIGERREAGYGERASEIAGELALHFEQGRDSGRAVRYRQVAAEHALRRNAFQEVYLHGTAGLALLKPLPDTPERKQLELRLRQLVSTALAATRGFMDDDLEDNLQRAQQLCRELEDDTTLVSVLVGLVRLHQVRANRGVIGELEQEEERLAERIQDAKLLVQLHTNLATSAAFRGLHARAAEHCQHVLRHYDANTHSLLLASFGGDPFVVVSASSGMSRSLAGQPDLGWDRVAQALVRAEELNQPLAWVTGLLYATIVKLLRGDYDEAESLAHKMEALTREYHFPLYRIVGGLLQGAIALQRGAVAEGIVGLTTELAQYRAIGAQLFVPLFLSFLAEGYRWQGKIDEARQVVNEALSLTATNLDRFWEAELYRLKGELLLAQSGVESLGSSVKTKQKAKDKKRARA